MTWFLEFCIGCIFCIVIAFIAFLLLRDNPKKRQRQRQRQRQQQRQHEDTDKPSNISYYDKYAINDDMKQHLNYTTHHTTNMYMMSF